MQNSFLSSEELNSIGFKRIGQGVFISRFARFYGIENIEIGNNVRIDDFCILSGAIKLGDYIHISAYTALYGRYGIELQDYSGLSPRCSIFSATDDFTGNNLVGPMINAKFTNVTGGKVLIEKYCQLGANCVVLPGVTIHEGVTVGAMSLVIQNLNGWKIYKGIPAVFYKDRSKKMLDYLK
ncbi:MAG TPA: acyltransferase [Bacteroidales bacterium]|nr:acyltransferase [Bacteroidales bacterium]